MRFCYFYSVIHCWYWWMARQQYAPAGIDPINLEIQFRKWRHKLNANLGNLNLFSMKIFTKTNKIVFIRFVFPSFSVCFHSQITHESDLAMVCRAIDWERAFVVACIGSHRKLVFVAIWIAWKTVSFGLKWKRLAGSWPVATSQPFCQTNVSFAANVGQFDDDCWLRCVALRL